MINMRTLRKIQNDIKWLVNKVEEQSRWQRKHDGRYPCTNDNRDEPAVETAAPTGEKEETVVERHEPESSEDVSRDEKASSG